MRATMDQEDLTDPEEVDRSVAPNMIGDHISMTVLRSVVMTVLHPSELVSSVKAVSPEFHFNAGPTQAWASEEEHQGVRTL